MSSEPYSIVNPKHNNRDLYVYFYDSRGNRRELAKVVPGGSCQPGKQLVWVEERPRPARLVANPDGTHAPDPKAAVRVKRAKATGAAQ